MHACFVYVFIEQVLSGTESDDQFSSRRVRRTLPSQTWGKTTQTLQEQYQPASNLGMQPYTKAEVSPHPSLTSQQPTNLLQGSTQLHINTYNDEQGAAFENYSYLSGQPLDLPPHCAEGIFRSMHAVIEYL